MSHLDQKVKPAVENWREKVGVASKEHGLSEYYDQYIQLREKDWRARTDQERNFMTWFLHSCDLPTHDYLVDPKKHLQILINGDLSAVIADCKHKNIDLFGDLIHKT